MEEGKLTSPQLSSPPSPTMAQGRLPSPQLPLPPSPTMEEGNQPSPAMQEGKLSSPPPSTMEEDKLPSPPPSPLPSTMEEGKLPSPPPSTMEEGKLPSQPPSPVKVVTEEQQEMVPADDAADPIKEEPPTEMLSGSPPATPRPVDPPERRYPQAPVRFFDGKKYGLPKGWLVDEKPRTNPKYIGKVDQSFEHVQSGKVFRSRKAAVRWIMAHPDEPGHQEFIAREEASKSSKRPRKSTEMKRTPQGLDASLKQGEENKSEKKKRGRPRKLSIPRESSANNAQDVQVVIASVNSDEEKVVPNRQSDDADDIANRMELDGSPTGTNSSERTK